MTVCSCTCMPYGDVFGNIMGMRQALQNSNKGKKVKKKERVWGSKSLLGVCLNCMLNKLGEAMILLQCTVTCVGSEVPNSKTLFFFLTHSFQHVSNFHYSAWTSFRTCLTFSKSNTSASTVTATVHHTPPPKFYSTGFPFSPLPCASFQCSG